MKDMTDSSKTSPLNDPQPIENVKEQLLSMLPPQVREVLDGHLREILAGICIAVLAVLLWAGYNTYSDYKENQAATALGAALVEPDLSKKAERLEKVVKTQAHTEAKRQALLLLGAVQREQGKTDQAEASFKKAKEEFPRGSAFRESATMGLGYLSEIKKDLKAAQEFYSEASKQNVGYEAVALLDLARVSTELGEKDKALDAYNEYIAQKPESPDLDYVRWLLISSQ